MTSTCLRFSILPELYAFPPFLTWLTLRRSSSLRCAISIWRTARVSSSLTPSLPSPPSTISLISVNKSFVSRIPTKFPWFLLVTSAILPTSVSLLPSVLFLSFHTPFLNRFLRLRGWGTCKQVLLPLPRGFCQDQGERRADLLRSRPPD